MIINGEIFLKRMPKSIYSPVEEDLEHLEIVNDSTDLEDLKPIFDYGTIDGCLSFWQAYGDEEGIDLEERSTMPSENLELHFNNLEDLKKEFIPLTEYLAKAKFIGRKWRLPDNLGIAKELLESAGEQTILYEYDSMRLVLVDNPDLGTLFTIMVLDPETIQQEKCLHEVNESANEYKDKTKTYTAVLKYLIKNKKKGL